MDGTVRLKIYLVSFREDDPEAPPLPPPVERIQRAFGVNREMAQHFLDSMPVAVKRKATKEEARSYVQTLHKIGAEVRVEPDLDQEEPAPEPPRATSFGIPVVDLGQDEEEPAPPQPSVPKGTMLGLPTTGALAQAGAKPSSGTNKTRLGRIGTPKAVRSRPAIETKRHRSSGEISMFEPDLEPDLDMDSLDPLDLEDESPLPLEEERRPAPRREASAEDFGLSEDWDAIAPEPDSLAQAPVPFPEELEVLMGKGSPAPEGATHGPGASQFDPHMLSMAGDSMSDPGLLGTEEYQAVMELARDEAPAQEDIPIALMPEDSLPSDPFGPPLGASMDAPAASRPRRRATNSDELPQEASFPSLNPAQLGLEPELDELNVERLPSLSALAADERPGREAVLPSFDANEAGAGLPSSPGPGNAPAFMPLPSDGGFAGTRKPPERRNSAPRPAPGGRQPTAPGVAALPPRFVEESDGDGRGFWEALPVALLSPFKGMGILWMPLLAVVQAFSGCLITLPCLLTKIIAGVASLFLYMGLLGTYFGASVRRGLDRDGSAPDLPDLDMGTLKGDILFRGAVLTLLAALMFALPIWAGWSVVADMLPENVAQMRSWDPEEPFYDKDGAQVELQFGDKARDLYDAQGKHVLVNPSGNQVEVLPEPEDLTPRPPDKGKMALFFFFLLVPMFYWPMALTVATMGSLTDMFNPAVVVRGIFKGGLKYLVVVGVPALVLVSMALFSLVTSAGGAAGGIASAACSLLTPIVFYVYINGVQGHMIGRMLGDNPDDFADLVE